MSNSSGRTSYYQNTGNSTNPNFAPPITSDPFGLTDVGGNASSFFVDIDGDGKIDALIGNQSGDTIFFRNTGSNTAPSFASPSTNPFGLSDIGSFVRPSFVDIDGNETLDAFIGNGAGNTIFFRNTGSNTAPAFASPSTNPFGLSNVGANAHPFFVDIDGNETLDAFIGNGSGNTIFFRNTGSNTAPAFAAPSTNPFGLIDIGGNARPTFFDINGDGTLDALIGENSGNTIFFLNPPPPPPVGVTITLSDNDTKVTEGGATDTYDIVLDSAPTNDVTIALIGTLQVTTDTPTITFTTANWNVAQTVTVTAVDDTVGEGVHYSAINATVSSADANYNSITVDPVRVIIEDNDLPLEDPTFQTPVSNPFGLTNVDFTASPSLIDIDGDGDLDAFIGNYDGNTIFYRNTGDASSPSFSSESTNPFGLTDVGYSASPTFADIDGDGDLDAFIGNKYGITTFYRNTGSASAPSFTSESNNFGLTNVGSYASPTFADIDGDGDLDAFIGNSDGNTIFFRNTGSASAPSFISESNNFGLTNLGNVASPTLADIDGNGVLDAFIGNNSGNTRFYRNTGDASAPSFTSESNNFGLTDVGLYASPILADIDGDGDLDAFIGNQAGDTIFFLNAPPAGVTITPRNTNVKEGGATDTYDIVLDSAPTDGVTITLIGTVQVTTDTPTITFTTANWNTPQPVTVTAVDDTVGEGVHYSAINATVSSADANYNSITVDPVRVIIEDNDLPQEDPNFRTPVSNPFGLTDVGSFASPTFADIDGDGDLDAFIGEEEGDTFFYRNTGSATAPSFSSPSTNPFGLTNVGSYASPTFADIDADGDLDAFIGESYGNTIFYRNTGTASDPSFVSQGNNFGLTDVGSYASPTFADIDGDGDLDAFIGEEEGDTFFYRNTGSATAPSFSSPSTNPFGLTNVGSYASPTFADIDADGDLDAFIGESYGNTIFYRNTGSTSDPSFVSQGNNFGLTDVGSYASPTFADIDADGDLDAFIGEEEGDTFFFLNQDNLPPTVANPIVDQNTFEQVVFDFTVPANTFSDPDVGDTLTYTATLADDTTLPVWLDFDANTQTFSGTPTNGDIGTIMVKVTATDTGALSVSDTFDIEIQQLSTLVTNSTGGNDTLTGGIGFNLIDVGSGNDSITGNVVADTLKGGSGNDTLQGLAGDDLLDGGSGNDLLTGGNGNDRITGGSGIDTLTGGMGEDTLAGGSGADVFLFNSSNEGVDSITDFKVTEDKIWINKNGFDPNLSVGVLDVNAFVRGSSATTADHRFIYNPSNGLLSFDADGVGGGASIELAQLRSGLGMTNANIMVFGGIS